MTSPLLLVCAVCLKCAVDFFWHGIGVENTTDFCQYYIYMAKL